MHRPIVAPGAQVAQLILSPKEIERYSFGRALAAARSGDWRLAGYERELSTDLSGRGGESIATPHRVLVPNQVIRAAVRDLSAASASAGGYLVGTDNGGVIDALRPIMVTRRLGAQTVPALKANMTWARQGGTATIAWAPNEMTAATETQTLNFGQTAGTPKVLVLSIETSRHMQLQSPEMLDQVLTRELAVGVATGCDAAALNGSGAAGQPLGVLNTPGLQTFTGASLSWVNALVPQGQILGANALSDGGRVAYVTTPAVAQVAANRQGFSTTAPLWVGGLAEGQLAGCLAMSSTQMPAATLLAGDWSRMMLLEWGAGVMIDANPYANFPAGITGYRAILMCDVVLESISAFSVATSVS